MLQWLRSLFGRQQTSPDDARMQRMADANLAMRARLLQLKARYDAAQTNEDNRRHWGNADGLSASGANTPSVRRILRNRSRYEYDNGGYCNGIVRSRADDLVATGPTLQILSDDDALNEQIEKAFAAWARACCFAEKLHTMDQARDRDGEVFGLLINNPMLRHPVKLDIDPIEADQIGDPWDTDYAEKFSGGGFRLGGITYDAAKNPISYSVLKEHPGDLLRVFPLDFDEVRAEYVLHWFRRDRPGQFRGVPELTSALPLFAYLRRWTLATLSAAEIAASFAALLETDAPPDETDPPEPFESLEIERGMMTTLPSGSRAHQLEAEHPTSTYSDFKREVIGECSRPVRMPTNVALADSSRHNFSSAKLDHFGYRGALTVDRHFAEINLLDRVFLAWVMEAERLGIVPKGTADLPRAWYWPGWPSMDKDEAQHVTERLNNGTTTLQEECAADGKDWKDRIRQRGRELRMMEAEGVPPPPGTEKGTDDVEEMEETPAGATEAKGHQRLNGFSRHSRTGSARG